MFYVCVYVCVCVCIAVLLPVMTWGVTVRLRRNFVAPFLWHRIDVAPAGGRARSEKVYGDDGATTYEHQLRAFVAAARARPSRQPEGAPGTPDEAVRVMRVIDGIYAAAGMRVRGSSVA